MKMSYSAGGVVVGPQGKVLVASQNGNSWSLPKGHIEKGESRLDAARREIFEETGVKTLVHVKDLGTYERFRIGLYGGDDPNEMKTISMFLFTTDEERLAPQDPKNPEARWVDPSEVARMLTHPKDREFFESISHDVLACASRTLG